jgi:hypothetical protein
LHLRPRPHSSEAAKLKNTNLIETLQQSPLLLLFTVIAIGYGVGEVRIRSFKLGVAAVLFVGLGFGALSPDLTVPQFIIFLGLAIFVYTDGMASKTSILRCLPCCCLQQWLTELAECSISMQR